MKISNTLLTILTLFLFSNMAFAQNNKKATQLAEDRVQEINNMITSINPDAELSSDQKMKIIELHINRTKKIQAVKKNDSLSEEEKKSKIVALRKEFGRTYSKEILTQEQRQAKKESKTMSAKGDNN